MPRCNPVYTDSSAQSQQENCHPQRCLTQRKGIVEQDHRLMIGDNSKVSTEDYPKDLCDNSKMHVLERITF